VSRTLDRAAPKSERPRCDAKAYPVQGQAEPVIICSHCGDVSNEPRCPHDTPEKSWSGLDI
jgi:hypothetical protein